MKEPSVPVNQRMNIILLAISYFAGLVLIALGVNIAKLSNLGISSVSSVSGVMEQLTPLTLGQATMMIYTILLLLQILLLKKQFPIRNILGIPLSILFGFILDIVGTNPDAIGHLLYHFPQPHNYFFRLIYCIIATFLIGTGVFLYTKPKWVPLPAEGLSGAIHTVTGRSFGDCKSIVDTGMICVAVILQLLFLGGFRSFITGQISVREGTIITGLFAGQVVKFWEHISIKKNPLKTKNVF